MKDLFSSNNIRKQLEVLNIAIGFTLVAIAAVYLNDGEVEYAASWFIFGCMYMVMDKYWPSDSYSLLRTKADLFKYLINIIALVVSIAFFVYLLVN